MHTISSHSRYAAPSLRRRPAARRAAAAGLSAAALVLIAACGNGSAGGPGTSNPKLSPRDALLSAAVHTRQVTSAVETLTVKASGVQSTNTTGTILIQLKPTLQLAATLNIGAAGKNTQIKEVLTGQAIYFNAAALASQLGKPWVKISLSALKGTAGASFAQLFHSLQSNNFTNQTELLTVAKDAHVVGTGTVGGVATTEYAGSLKASQALKALPAGFRKALGSMLSALGNTTISFHVWIDGQSHVRKITEAETAQGETINTTVNITAINQPVHITVPPASQIASMPGL
jgi:hypothetical protein